ncbi:MAG: MATE family efflux transporter [Candidatus Gastranaerophilales bacterium]|nr:MATE family efflux transporter [Candidatus Gastranaerophilales bacterium]
MSAIKAIFQEYKTYFTSLISLSLPIIAGNLGHILIGTVDVIIAAYHSTFTLAGISLATAIFMTFLIGAIGLTSSISPVISNLRGAKKPTKKLLLSTIVYSQIVSLFFFILLSIVTFLIPKIGLAEGIAPYVITYLKITNFSIFGGILFNALKEFLQAYEIVVFPNALSIIAIFLNLILCIIFVFGGLGIPSLGIAGLAYAALIVRSLIGIILLIYCLPLIKFSTRKYNHYIKDLLKVGLPMSFALFFEFLGFNTTAVLLGTFSALLAATHNVIITITGMIYMIPLAISNAISIKVGFSNGEKNITNVKRYTIAGIILILGYMTTMIILCSVFPSQILGLFTPDKTIVTTAIPVISIVCCFLLFDGLQCASAGALKGLKETKAIMLTMCLSYLVLGIPIGCILAFKFNIVLTGFWLGLAIALFAAGMVATGILIYKIKKLQYKYDF